MLLLLHGFPQCWYLWRHQIDEMVAAGRQGAVSGSRGCGGSDKPATVEAYDAGELVADAVGIADALGHKTFTLVTLAHGLAVAASLYQRLRRTVITLLAALLVVPALSVAPVARADDGQFQEPCPQPDPNCWSNESRYTAFYTPPDPLPAGKPGDLIRSEPSPFVLEPSGQLGAYVATGTRIMYRSTDNNGQPISVTGTYFEPDNPWPGKGPRPLIAFATGPGGSKPLCESLVECITAFLAFRLSHTLRRGRVTATRPPRPRRCWRPAPAGRR